jgi:hypothetical protein
MRVGTGLVVVLGCRICRSPARRPVRCCAPQPPPRCRPGDCPPWSGKLIFHVFGALAQFKRDLIREGTHAGLQAARGRLFGRPRALNPRKIEQLRTLAKDERTTVAEICQTIGISRATFYRYVR